MANAGRFIDRNESIRAAGVASILDSDNTTRLCLTISHREEIAEHLIRTECKRKQLENIDKLLPSSPCLPDVSVPALLAVESSKSRFAVFMEKTSEDMYLKQPKLGQVKQTHSKPDSVTNLSQTFGKQTPPFDRLYDIILPPKTVEQVNREHGDFHEKYIVSHSHYFPAEQINRKYDAPYARFNTYGSKPQGDVSGHLVKRCMQQCADHVIIISKEQMDFIDRTYDRLGKKYKKYPYNVPQHATYGIPTFVPDCDGKMLIEDISPCVSNRELVEALGHLNMWRHKLQKRANFQMFDLQSVLENSDKEGTRHLPLRKIFEIMHKMHLYIDVEKARRFLAHFQMIVDEGCPTERLNYDKFCRLLAIQYPLPTMGNISTSPSNVYNKDTIYRLFCADLNKEPIQAPVAHKLRPKQLDDDNTHVKDLLQPDTSVLYGVTPSDFECLRPKEHLELIFKDIISPADFETIWKQLMDTHSDQNGFISVMQFREVMDNLESNS